MAKMGLYAKIQKFNADSWDDKVSVCGMCEKEMGVKPGCDKNYIHDHLERKYCRACWIKHDHEQGWCDANGSVSTEQMKKWEKYMSLCK